MGANSKRWQQTRNTKFVMSLDGCETGRIHSDDRNRAFPLIGTCKVEFWQLKLQDYFLKIMLKLLYLPDLACSLEVFDVTGVDEAMLAVVTTT